MASPVTLYGASAIESTNWTSPGNATGANDSTSATCTTSGSVLRLTMDNETPGLIGTTTNVEFGLWWTAVNGTSARDQQAFVELISSGGTPTVYSSFTTPIRNNATLVQYNSSFTPAHNEATVNDYEIRITLQEGGGMGGTITHYVDAVYAIVTYNSPPDTGQARVMFIG